MRASGTHSRREGRTASGGGSRRHLQGLLPGLDLPSDLRPEGRGPHGHPGSGTASGGVRLWGNALPPTETELDWVRRFGREIRLPPPSGCLSERIEVEVANLKQATRIIVYHHYLHRGRTMAQLPYWVQLDRQRIGVVLFSLPRLSVPLHGIQPMQLLELARMWLTPEVQGLRSEDSRGGSHAFSVGSCAISRCLHRVREDWFVKYPALPEPLAVVSWADQEHHEGTVYRAANFREMGTSGGTLHGTRRRPNGGRDQANADYRHVKTLFLYRFGRRLATQRKRQLIRSGCNAAPGLPNID